jgi:hypothetical protein
VYSFTPSTGGESSVLVKWNRDAAGWELLSLEYNRTMFASDADSLEGYFAAGYAEGFLTFDDIYSQYVNQMLHLQQDLEENANATAFMVQNFANMKAYPTNTPFGFQVARIMKQLAGLAAGWNAYYALHKDSFKNISAPLDEEMLYRLNFESGLQTVLDKFSNHSRTGMAWQSARCSALVKVMDRELYFGHSTWYHYNTMLRQYKVYNFGDKAVHMSGYAGVIWSTDDFYMTSNKLAVMETTNGFANNSLYNLVLPTQAPEFLRVMAANYLATTPLEWFQYYATNNSGTYNTQYMVVNMAAAHQALEWGQPLPPGTFYVGEQLPGWVLYRDQTDFLNRRRYWPSYNVPYYKEIFNMSGFAGYDTPEMYNLYDYDQDPRAVMFARMNASAVDDVSFWYVMRYNDYQNDAASAIPWCSQNNGPYYCPEGQSPSFAISSRYDLNAAVSSRDSNAPSNLTEHVERALMGAIDTKITTARWMTSGFRAILQNGPSAVQQPVFDFKDFVYANPSAASEKWRGLPTHFDFPPLIVEVSSADPTTPPKGGVPPGAPGSPEDHADEVHRLKVTIAVLCVIFGFLMGFVVYLGCARRHSGRQRYNSVDGDKPLGQYGTV